jgi:ankyrin repeat protein
MNNQNEPSDLKRKIRNGLNLKVERGLLDGDAVNRFLLDIANIGDTCIIHHLPLGLVLKGQLDLLLALLEVIVIDDRDQWDWEWNLIDSLIGEAAKAGQWKIADRLLDYETSANLLDHPEHRSALSYAAEADQWELAEKLLMNGADPFLTDKDGRAPAHWAKIGNHLALYEDLIQIMNIRVENNRRRIETLLGRNKERSGSEE